MAEIAILPQDYIMLGNLKGITAQIPEDQLIYQFFEARVTESPERVALIDQDKRMTYLELNHQANQLAHYIRKIGIKPDQIVGLMVERSFEMMIGILGILKAGGAYLPINPSHPQERINYYLETSQVKTVLTVEAWATKLSDFEGNLISLEDHQLFQNEKVSNPDPITCPNHLAYVIYTSGSTGKPKGVMIEHRALVNRLYWMQKTYQLQPEERLLQKTSYSFDVSVWELLWWSMVGATLAILPPNKEKDPRALVKIIEKEKISIIHFVPSMLEVFLDYVGHKFDLNRLASLRYVIVSGEELTLPTARRFYELFNKLGTSLWNLYGPTEATIDVTAFDCDGLKPDAKKVPIGSPIDNIQLLIVDENNKMVPLGEKGELCISGMGVARGYVNNSQLTESLFVDNPYFLGKMYKTGDIASLNTDGLVEYHGRIDSQIKLRGLRIELGEIESQLLTYEGIKKTKVLVYENSMTNKFLVAFYQTVDNKNLGDLQTYLLKFLPDYMIPSKFIRVDSFPTNQNGKVDHKKLLENELFRQ